MDLHVFLFLLFLTFLIRTSYKVHLMTKDEDKDELNNYLIWGSIEYAWKSPYHWKFFVGISPLISFWMVGSQDPSKLPRVPDWVFLFFVLYGAYGLWKVVCHLHYGASIEEEEEEEE